MVISHIGMVVDAILLPLTSLPPILTLIIITSILSLVVLIYQRMIFSKESVKELRRRIDEIRENIVKIQGDNPEELNRLISEMLKMNSRLLKENLKVVLLSFFLGIVFFSWVSLHYSGYYVKLPLPFFDKISLIYFYIILCFVFGIVIGKLLEVR